MSNPSLYHANLYANPELLYAGNADSGQTMEQYWNPGTESYLVQGDLGHWIWTMGYAPWGNGAPQADSGRIPEVMYARVRVRNLSETVELSFASNSLSGRIPPGEEKLVDYVAPGNWQAWLELSTEGDNFFEFEILTEWEGRSDFKPNLLDNPELLSGNSADALRSCWNEELGVYELMGLEVTPRFEFNSLLFASDNNTVPQNAILNILIENLDAGGTPLGLQLQYGEYDNPIPPYILNDVVVPRGRRVISLDDWRRLDLNFTSGNSYVYPDLRVSPTWDWVTLLPNLLANSQLFYGPNQYWNEANGWYDIAYVSEGAIVFHTLTDETALADQGYRRPVGAHVQVRVVNRRTDADLTIVYTTANLGPQLIEIGPEDHHEIELSFWDGFSLALVAPPGELYEFDARVETRWTVDGEGGGDPEPEPELPRNLLENLEFFQTGENNGAAIDQLQAGWNAGSRVYTYSGNPFEIEFSRNRFTEQLGETYPSSAFTRGLIVNTGPRPIELQLNTGNSYVSTQTIQLAVGERYALHYAMWPNFYLAMAGIEGGLPTATFGAEIYTEWTAETLRANLFRNPEILHPIRPFWDLDELAYVVESTTLGAQTIAVDPQDLQLNQGYTIPENAFVRIRIVNRHSVSLQVSSNGSLGLAARTLAPNESVVYQIPGWWQMGALTLAPVTGTSVDYLIETDFEGSDPGSEDPDPPQLQLNANLFKNPELFTGTDVGVTWQDTHYLIQRGAGGGFTMMYSEIAAGLEPDAIPINNHIRARITNQTGNPITLTLTHVDEDGQNTTQTVGPLAVGARYELTETQWGRGYTLTIQGTGQFDVLIEPDFESEGPPPEPEPGEATEQIKAFISFGALAYNEPDQVAPAGELSNLSRSYSRDQRIYSRASSTTPATAVNLSVFSTRSLDTQAPVEPVEELTHLLLEIGRWAYANGLAGVFSANPDSFRLPLLSFFANEVYGLHVGPMVFDPNRGLWLPQAIDFTAVVETEDGEVRARARLWFADKAFLEQYDEFDFEFIGPMDRLDDFFKTANMVRVITDRRTLPELHQLVKHKAKNSPYTILRTEQFDYYPPGQPELRFPTSWSVVVWGSPRDHFDVLRQRLADWILSNSTRNREEWTAILPDIFTSTEFIISPLWTSYGIPNRTDDPGMYSPTVPLSFGLEVVQRTATGVNYTEAMIGANTSILNTTYKSLAMLVTGGPENRNKLNHFFRAYRDYLAISTASPDFDRMKPKTRQFVEFLHFMLFVAESMTEYTALPDGVTRVWRTNGNGDRILYAAARYENIQYLVVSKHAMNYMFPPDFIQPLQLTANGVEGQTRLPHMTNTTYEVEFLALGGQGPYLYSLVGAESTDWWPLTSISIDPVTGVLTATRSSGSSADLVISIRVVDHDQREVTVNFDLHVVGF